LNTETTAISDATENNITETAVLAEQYVTTTDAVTENVNQKALSSIGFNAEESEDEPKSVITSNARL
jgi:hypothetical protein